MFTEELFKKNCVSRALRKTKISREWMSVPLYAALNERTRVTEARQGGKGNGKASVASRG